MSFLMRRNCPSLARCVTTSILAHRMYGMSHRFQENFMIHPESLRRANDLSRSQRQNQYMAQIDPRSYDRRNLRKKTVVLMRHPLNDEYKAQNAKYRWSQFRRKMIYGNFAV